MKKADSAHPRRRMTPATRLAATLALTGVLAGIAPACFAQQSFALLGGTRNNVDSYGLQWTMSPWFTSNPGGWRITGSPEVQLNLHHHDGDDMWQGGAFANFRFEPPVQTLRPYLELGLGLNVLSRNDLGSKDFSTRFQFGEYVGLGVAWGGSRGGVGETWLGARVTHYSNAGIDLPNPGLETFQLVLGHRF